MAASLRILHLASHGSLHRGGAVQMIRLACGLTERGHRVTAIFNAPPDAEIEGDAPRRAAAAGVEIRALDLKTSQSRAQFRELWRAGEFDVLHVHREEALLFAAHALVSERVPCFVAQRGTVYLPDWFSEEHRLLWGGRVDTIVAVAQAVKRALVWRRLIPPGKIEVIYGGVETKVFRPGVDGCMLRLRRHVPPGALVVMLPGALVEKKGTEHFIHAAALVRKRRQGIQYWIVGSGKREEQMRALAEDLEFGPTMDFLGHCDNMPEVYAASDLVVCASVKGEGLTGTLREALAMERPVVTTDVAGNTELVEEGRTGYVARVANPESLADAILRALNDPARAQALARAGRERVLAWCGEAVRSQKVETLYRAVLDRRRNA